MSQPELFTNQSQVSENKNLPKLVERDGFGLIKGVNYTFTEDGRVDWRKMLLSEHLVINKGKTQERDIAQVSEKNLLILLAGFKYLLRLRGYSSIEYTQLCSRPDFVSMGCRITFLPNYETEGQPVTYESCADARPENTGSGIIDGKPSIFHYFLTTIAENRAFVRCVRNFLGINILAQDEIGGQQTAEEPTDFSDSSPSGILKKTCENRKISFEQLKIAAVRYKDNLSNDPLQWENWQSVCPKDAYVIIGKINEKQTVKS